MFLCHHGSTTIVASMAVIAIGLVATTTAIVVDAFSLPPGCRCSGGRGRWTSSDTESPTSSALPLRSSAHFRSSPVFSTTAIFSSPPSSASDACTPQSSCHILDLFGRHYQLEEREDSEIMMTDIYLRDDNTITLGITNGPRHLNGGGTWSESFVTSDVQDDASRRSFDMTLTRTYLGGKTKNYDESDWGYRHVDDTNVGEFAYTVIRSYVGEIILVGGTLLSMSGIIVDIDEVFGNRDVGYFNMIDTTEERINYSMSMMTKKHDEFEMNMMPRGGSIISS